MISVIAPWRFMPRILSIWKFQEILGILSVGLLMCLWDYLQKLSCATELTIGSWSTELDNYFCDFEENNTDLQSWISSIVFPNLKNITIVNSILVCLNRQKRKRGFRRLVKLSQLLLKNATILKKFLIISKSRRCKKCKKCLRNCGFNFFFGLLDKLYPSGSSANAKIIFQDQVFRD